MGKNEQGASKPANDTAKEAGQDARCAEGMMQAMAEMIESCGCCEGMMERFGGTRRARRTPDSPAAKA